MSESGRRWRRLDLQPKQTKHKHNYDPPILRALVGPSHTVLGLVLGKRVGDGLFVKLIFFKGVVEFNK